MTMLDHTWALTPEGAEPDVDEFDPDAEYERRRDEKHFNKEDAA